MGIPVDQPVYHTIVYDSTTLISQFFITSSSPFDHHLVSLVYCRRCLVASHVVKHMGRHLHPSRVLNAFSLVDQCVNEDLLDLPLPFFCFGRKEAPS